MKQNSFEVVKNEDKKKITQQYDCYMQDFQAVTQKLLQQQ